MQKRNVEDRKVKLNDGREGTIIMIHKRHKKNGGWNYLVMFGEDENSEWKTRTEIASIEPYRKRKVIKAPSKGN